MGNPTMWFEVAAKDREATEDLLLRLFDWQLNDMEAMPYTIVDTGGEGIPAGSVTPRRAATVTSLLRAGRGHRGGLAKAECLGGKRVMGPMGIPSGEIGLFTDPEGHQIGLMTRMS